MHYSESSSNLDGSGTYLYKAIAFFMLGLGAASYVVYGTYSRFTQPSSAKPAISRWYSGVALLALGVLLLYLLVLFTPLIVVIVGSTLTGSAPAVP